LLRLFASHSIAGGLHFENTAVGISALAAREGVHGLLQSIALPSEEVVTMLAVPLARIAVSNFVIYAWDSSR